MFDVPVPPSSLATAGLGQCVRGGDILSAFLLFEGRYHQLIANVSSCHPFIISESIYFYFCCYFFVFSTFSFSLLHSYSPSQTLIISHVVVMRVWCTTQQLCDKALRAVLQDGGEGVILRRPASRYEHGRSLSLFKIKVLFTYELMRAANVANLVHNCVTWRRRVEGDKCLFYLIGLQRGSRCSSGAEDSPRHHSSIVCTLSTYLLSCTFSLHLPSSSLIYSILSITPPVSSYFPIITGPTRSSFQS